MEKIIHIGDSSINTKWINTHSGISTVLVFLHEALGSIPQWKAFPEKLCGELKLSGIIIERSGHGKSGELTGKRGADYLHNYTRETKAVLDELLPVDTKIILIGHSDGGTIALLYAKLFPRNLSAICTMAAHTFVEPETLAGIEPAVEAFENGKLDGLRKFHGEKTTSLFYAWANVWREEFFSSWDIREEIKGIIVPVLALQGADDQYGTAEQLHSISEAANNAEIHLIPGCGHHPHIEKMEETVGIISEWSGRIGDKWN